MTARFGHDGSSFIVDPANVISSRNSALTFYVPGDGAYIFGGFGYGSSGPTAGYLNDLWHFIFE